MENYKLLGNDLYILRTKLRSQAWRRGVECFLRGIDLNEVNPRPYGVDALTDALELFAFRTGWKSQAMPNDLHPRHVPRYRQEKKHYTPGQRLSPGYLIRQINPNYQL